MSGNSVIAYYLPLQNGKKQASKVLFLACLELNAENGCPVLSAVGLMTPKPDRRGPAWVDVAADQNDSHFPGTRGAVPTGKSALPFDARSQGT